PLPPTDSLPPPLSESEILFSRHTWPRFVLHPSSCRKPHTLLRLPELTSRVGFAGVTRVSPRAAQNGATMIAIATSRRARGCAATRVQRELGAHRWTL